MRSKSKQQNQSPEQSENKRNPRTIMIGIAIVIGVLGLGYLLALNLRGETPIEDMVTFLRQSRGHDGDQTYTGTLPPAGGLHSDIWQNCGIYDQPIDASNVMHSLEHGAAWVSYNPSLEEAEVATLRDMVRGESHLLLAPYPDLQSPVVLTAWEVQLELDSVNDGRISEFIDRYQRGPRSPEPGATCGNGVGSPIE